MHVLSVVFQPADAAGVVSGKKRPKGKKRPSMAPPTSPTPASTPGKGGNKDKNKRAAPQSAIDRAFKPIKEWYVIVLPFKVLFIL